MQFSINDVQTNLETWSKTFTLKPDPWIDLNMRLFKYPENEHAHLRIDNISVMGMMNIEIGGGPLSFVEVDLDCNSVLEWSKLEPKVSWLLAAIQHQYPTLHFEFDSEAYEKEKEYRTWWASASELKRLEEEDEEYDEGFRW